MPCLLTSPGHLTWYSQFIPRKCFGPSMRNLKGIFPKDKQIRLHTTFNCVSSTTIGSIPARTGTVDQTEFWATENTKYNTFLVDNIQSSAFITRSNFVRYFINKYRNWCRISIRCWIHKRHTIPRPNGLAMGSFLNFCEKIDRVITAPHCTLVN